MQTSLDEFYRFLDHTEVRGILPKATVQNRRAAAKAVFTVLEGDDAAASVEYVIENFDTVLHRFTVKNRAEVKGQTIETYKSRLKSALQDFKEWTENPSAWERSLHSKGQKPKAAKKDSSDRDTAEKRESKPSPPPEAATAESTQHAGASHARGGRLISLPIRAGQFEITATIPQDGLSMAEFLKFGSWLIHYLKEDQVNDQPQMWQRLLESSAKGERNL